MLSVAVLGCGRIGRMHARNVAGHERTRLAGVFDIDGAAAHAVGEALQAQVFNSGEAAIHASETQAVLIATSTETHSDYIEMAVAAGKPVLCEKPIDLSLERVDRCAARIAGSAVPIMIGFVRRFDPGHAAVQRAVRQGTVGELRQVVITSRDPGMAPAAYIERSGGIFRDMTIHDLDMARFVLGEEPETVFATGSRLVDPALMQRAGDWDVVTVVLATASGKQCIINNSRQCAYGYDQRVEAFGSAGMMVSENRRPHGARLFSADYTERAEPYLNFFIERYQEAFAAEIGAFADAAATGQVPSASFDDGRRALVLAEAALRSVKENRIVRVAEIG